MRFKERLRRLEALVAAGGGGGGGDLALGLNGAFGDPTQEPCFLGYFADVNDLWAINDFDPSIYVDGCWAVAEETPGDGNPKLWILNMAVTGWWVRSDSIDGNYVMDLARSVGNPTVLTAHWSTVTDDAGQFVSGLTRRIYVGFAGTIREMSFALGIPGVAVSGGGTPRFEFGLRIGRNDGSGNFIVYPESAELVKSPTQGRPYIASNQRQGNPAGASYGDNTFIAGDTIEVICLDKLGRTGAIADSLPLNFGPPGGVKDLTVLLRVDKA